MFDAGPDLCDKSMVTTNPGPKKTTPKCSVSVGDHPDMEAASRAGDIERHLELERLPIFPGVAGFCRTRRAPPNPFKHFARKT
jgi:hypothetical protein